MVKRDLLDITMEWNVWTVDPGVNQLKFKWQLGKFKYGLNMRWYYRIIGNYVRCENDMAVM